MIDGETVVLNKDGVSDFDALRSRKHDKRAQFYALDMLAGDGEDHRWLALVRRKTNLAQLLSRSVRGIFIAEYEQCDIGPTYSALPATWASKASSQSGLTARMLAASAGTGSR